MLNIYSSLCKNYIILIHIFKEYIWVFIDLFTENCIVKSDKSVRNVMCDCGNITKYLKLLNQLMSV